VGDVIRYSRGLWIYPFLLRGRLPISVGSDVEFRSLRSLSLGQWVFIGGRASIGKSVTIGNSCYVGKNTFLDQNVIIEDRVSIARNCTIMTSTHRNDDPTRRSGKGEFVSEIVIGTGSWIGTGVMILPKVNRIGKFSIVGAGSVVTKDVPENTVVAGNPARVIRVLDPLTAPDDSR